MQVLIFSKHIFRQEHLACSKILFPIYSDGMNTRIVHNKIDDNISQKWTKISFFFHNKIYDNIFKNGQKSAFYSNGTNARIVHNEIHDNIAQKWTKIYFHHSNTGFYFQFLVHI